MSSRNLDDAEPNLRIRFNQTRRRFSKTFIGKRYEIRVSCVLRTDEEQKIIYWSTRREGPKGKIINLTRWHKTYQDGVIRKSRHQANARGLSEAIDFFVINKKTGKASWTCKIVYRIFGRVCEKYHLEWGGRFKGFADLCHVQLPV